MSLSTHLVYIGDMKADRSGASLTRSPVSLHFPLDILCTVRVIGNQSKHQWCRYSDAVTLCNRHLFHNDTLNEKACQLQVFNSMYLTILYVYYL